jgi:hypothetical protein
MENNTTEDILMRRTALFNVKVRNMGIREIFKRDYAREKELEIERDKLAVILSSKGMKNVDSILLKPKEYRESQNEN